VKLVQKARAQASPIAEEGRATAQAMRSMGAAWAAAGADAKRVFLAQNLGTLSSRVLDSVKGLDVDSVTVIDASLAGGGDLATTARVASEKLKATLGVDVPRLVGGLTPSPSN
jgi:flotillin